VRRYDIGVGPHGDHIDGEREAARALAAGQVAAACMTDANHLLFGREGTLPPGGTRILTSTWPTATRGHWRSVSPQDTDGFGVQLPTPERSVKKGGEIPHIAETSMGDISIAAESGRTYSGLI
jgi:hypothetical protein